MCRCSSLTCSDHRGGMPARPWPCLFTHALPTYGLSPASIRYTRCCEGDNEPIVPLACKLRNSKTSACLSGWRGLAGLVRNSFHADGRAAVSDMACFFCGPPLIARSLMWIIASALQKMVRLRVPPLVCFFGFEIQ